MVVEVALKWSSMAATTETEFDIEPGRVSADCHKRYFRLPLPHVYAPTCSYIVESFVEEV
jgi:hypothetical protein